MKTSLLTCTSKIAGRRAQFWLEPVRLAQSSSLQPFELGRIERVMWAADLTQLPPKNTYAECLRLWQKGLP